MFLDSGTRLNFPGKSIFVTAFVILSGLPMMVPKTPDIRFAFVIGLPIIFGLSLAILPELFSQVPA